MHGLGQLVSPILRVTSVTDALVTTLFPPSDLPSRNGERRAASLEGFGRADVDGYAAQSQQRAATAIAEGRFDRSLIPVTDADGAVVLEQDEHPRPGTTADKLAALKPAFAAMGTVSVDGEDRTFDQICLDRYPDVDSIDHVHHAGNSSGVVDGAAATAIVTRESMLCSRRPNKARARPPRLSPGTPRSRAREIYELKTRRAKVVF